MDKLWAPWRIGYVAKKKKEYCIFCRIAKEKNDKKNYICLRSQYCFAVLNTFPYNNGHILIVPYRHIARWDKITTTELTDINETLKKILKFEENILKPHGFNIGMNLGEASGAGIAQHLHIHIVPRWRSDANFMPTIAAARIIPQSLDELWARLNKELKKI